MTTDPAPMPEEIFAWTAINTTNYWMKRISKDHESSFTRYIRADLATPPAQDAGKSALDYFMKNADGRTALDVFESLVSAMKKADAAVVAKDDVAHEIWFNIATCEMMQIAREYEYAPMFRRALTAPPDITAVREALEKAIGDILYLANERNEIDRFKGTTDECGAAITILNRVDGGENG